MSQDYLFECQRAELLGQTPPTEEEWNQKCKINFDNDNDEDNNDDAEKLEQSDESMKRIGGGLDELNSILSATQKKINRFKTVCGSLGSLLKVTGYSRNATPEHQPQSSAIDNESNDKTEENDETLTIETADTENSMENNIEKNYNSSKKIDINEKMGSHLDKLDSLITKAENAQYSMQHQTKQMKKILKK
ncbi:uncharacterized protein LOC103580799 [Microplitis demolitor]|uniref:uncharacterized protein LOC103580799 n=1 Tax=Microplitis demolitor TaxID=69319 RepID=UPI0006D5226D|nr:uncharacterized protein LOC103580799 [Microplitis demolitor]